MSRSRGLSLGASLLVGWFMTVMAPGQSEASSTWINTGPSTSQNPSVWLPIGKAHDKGTANGSSRPIESPSSLLPFDGTPQDQIPQDKPSLKGFSRDPNTYRPFYWDTIISMILDRVTNRMYAYNEFELLNHQCAYHTSPVLMNWHLQVMAKVWCPGWTTLKGTAITTRMARSIEFATKDFVRRVLISGIISEDQAQVWLSSVDDNYSHDVEA